MFVSQHRQAIFFIVRVAYNFVVACYCQSGDSEFKLKASVMSLMNWVNKYSSKQNRT